MLYQSVHIGREGTAVAVEDVPRKDLKRNAATRDTSSSEWMMSAFVRFNKPLSYFDGGTLMRTCPAETALRANVRTIDLVGLKLA